MRIRPSSVGWLRVTVAALFLSSCSGDTAGPEGPDPTAVAQVTVSTPGTSTVNVGNTLQLQAAVTNAQGAPLGNTVSWSSSPMSVATVSSTGLVSGVSQGTATITASAGGKSGQVQITVNDPRPPAAPSNVVATPFSDTEIDVTWTDNADNETGFTIEREQVAAGAPARTPAAVFSQAGTAGPNATTFRDSGLQPGTSYRYRVSATNGNGSVASEASSTTESHETLEVVTGELGMGTVNVAYAQALEAAGGNGTFAWAQTGGTMPPGLVLQTAGTIQGTPTQAGDFDLTLTVTSGGQSLAVEYTITINEEILAPEVVTTALPDGSVGNAYAATLEARLGDGSYAWAVTSGSLPAGLSLAANGAVSGVPAAAGTVTFTVQVTSAELTGTGDVTITIRPPLTVTTTILPTGVVGTPYAAQLEAGGGDGSFTWTALTDLPPGIALAAGGALSGTPTAAGTTEVTFRVTSGDGQAVDVALDVTINDVLAVTTESLPDGQIGQAYSQTLEASGGSGSNTWSVTAGSLPAGLGLVPAGLVSGTPTAVGASTFTVQVVSSDGQTATMELTITVVAGPVTVTTTSLPGGQVGTAYNASVTASGGDGVSYAWSVTAGSLPGGLALNGATGAITGTPSAAGTFTFTVQATSGGQSGSKELSITVSDVPPVTVTTTSLPQGSVGTPYSQTLTATGGDGTYTWALAFGSLPAGLSLNGSTGVISGTPTTVETQVFTVRATSAGVSGIRELSITIGSGGGGAGFDVTLVYLSSISATHMAAFESARARWEAIITEDLTDIPGGEDACPGGSHPATAGNIDDLVIYVTVEPIDGPFMTVGRAGPCWIRGGNSLPYTGSMMFDEADLDRLHGDGLLVPTILHEMGHVLGIGTLWDFMGLISGSCTVDPQFTGAAAAGAFAAAGGAGNVPIENEGSVGDGSNCGHWRQSVFDDELMTKTLNNGANPLSAVSIESLGDQGYSVDASQADAYLLPVAPPQGAPTVEEGAVTLVNDILDAPIVRRHPDGRIEVVRPGGRR